MVGTIIKCISMGCIYAEDFDTSYKFYNKILGLNDVVPMGKKACYFKLGDQGIYLVGGYNSIGQDENISRTTFTFEVDSAFNMQKKLQEEKVKIIQDELMKMTDESKPKYWFQCYDPSNNIIEFLGGE